MKILVTGSDGFIGQNLVAELQQKNEHDLYLFDRGMELSSLETALLQADIVFHLAGVNRPEDPEEFEQGNVDFTQQIVQLLEKHQRKTPIVFSSSIQAELPNAYGRSKKKAEQIIEGYTSRTGAKGFIYRFPNIFGKWCRPNYNSVVATFCYNIARGKPIRIDDPARELPLVYIDDVVCEFVRILEQGNELAGGLCDIAPIYCISLGELAGLLHKFQASRTNQVHDYDRSDPLLLKLYAAFTSYLPERELAIVAEMKTDSRGFFSELIKSPYFGQISVSLTKPGVIRGNHWHHTKVEKFIVISGEAVIRFRRIDSAETIDYHVSGSKLEIVDIPPGYTHSIENIGNSDLITLFWAGDIFDSKHPDTFFLEV